MKLTKITTILLLPIVIISLAGCKKKTQEAKQNDTAIRYADIRLGESYKNIKATIHVLNHKTDMLQADYAGVSWAEYIKEFNKMYPNITVNVEGVTDYASTAILRLQGGDWGDIMMIPAVDKADLPTYFLSYGDLATMNKQIRFATTWEYGKNVYGIPSMANAQGMVYNKAVFKKAGITTLPKTPEEFIADLKLIKKNTDAVPLYTNYAAGWTMGAWDAYIGGSATGDPKYMNQILPHEKNPFASKSDDTHAYAVYKILYDATKDGLIEDDYSTTDWESCKGKINNGKIATMALGSWAFSQMVNAGPHGVDIGYMPFPITIKGKQYATAGGDYSYGINVKATDVQKKASMVFVKWMTEKSKFAYNEGGIPIAQSDSDYPTLYKSFSDNNVTYVADEPALPGEEDLLNTLNSYSELNINAGGNLKVQRIIEHAANNDEAFDDIMTEWNKAWTNAQTKAGI